MDISKSYMVNPIRYRGDKLWYKILSASSGAVHNHTLAKMKVLGNFIPSDIKIIISHAKFIHKYSTANDSCAAALRNSGILNLQEGSMEKETLARFLLVFPFSQKVQ